MLSRCPVLVVFAVSLLAQTSTGEWRVLVRDPSGAPAAGASVILSSDSVHIRQEVRLPPDGRYSFRHLPLGLYHLQVTQPGFQPYSERITVRSEVPLNQVVTLSLEPMKASVDVNDADSLLDPGRTNSAQYVGQQQIAERASGTPGRGLVDLIAAQPGWTLEANGILHPRESEYDTQFVINGFPLQENRSPAFLRPTGTDNVQSMKVYTSGIPAEFGNKLGGVIEVTTLRNTSPGFHGTAIAGGGSFSTASGYLLGQLVQGRTTTSLSTDSFVTGRYLDPPVQNNFSNHGSSAGFDGTLEHDFSESNRLRVTAAHQQTGFLVPNDLLQQSSGQRQDRRSAESEGRVSYEHVFSPELLGTLRGSVRDAGATFWSNPLSTPIAADQDRGFREGYFHASLAGHYRAHEWKAGAEARYASLREQFDYQIRSYDLNGQPLFDSALPASFAFAEKHPDREQAAYVQDTFSWRSFTLSAGLRFDHYSLLVNQTGWSPRLGVSWIYRPTGTVLHASYDRTFGTPPSENLLVSAAAASLFGQGLYLPLRPSRGNYYEGGLTQALGRRVRLDASYFLREISDLKDDNLLLNTGVSFPIAFQHARIRGAEVKLEVPQWGRFSGFLSYANTTGLGQFPITGGLFLDSGARDLLNSRDVFPITQDQRNAAHARLRYQLHSRVWTAWSASYNSGLPVDDNLPEQDILVSQFGLNVVKAVNFDRGRVHPGFSLDASIGADLWRREKHSLTLQADAFNLTNRVNLINFAGLLSGTALGPPRSFSLRLHLDF